jgi:hypothetical protein
MKELWSYLSNKDDRFKKMRKHGLSLTVYSVLALFLLCVQYIKSDNDNWFYSLSFLVFALALCCVWDLGILLFKLSGLVINIIHAVRFQRSFGFYPASTAEGRKVMQNWMKYELRNRASFLQVAYRNEEEAMRQLKLKINVLEIAEQELKIWQLKAISKKNKRDFYQKRDLAKRVGFEIYGSFKDYLLTDQEKRWKDHAEIVKRRSRS